MPSCAIACRGSTTAAAATPRRCCTRCVSGATPRSPAATGSSPSPRSTRRAGRLLLVRDRFGVKPLYYAPRTDGLWFASEIGVLLAAGIERRPRADVLVHTLDHGWANGPLTGVEGVYRVLPGHAIEVDLATARTTRMALV